MTTSVQPGTPPEPYFHDASGAVRFWVQTGPDRFIGATIRREALHFRFQPSFQPSPGGDDAVATYRRHQHEIDAAVLRRVAAGSIEPVMLREADMPLPPRA